MAAVEIQYADIGTDMILTVYRADGQLEDQLGSASVIKIIMKGQDGDAKIKTAVLVTDGSDGKMKYPLAAGDMDELGTWTIQGYIERGSGKWYTSTRTFYVKENIGVIT